MRKLFLLSAAIIAISTCVYSQPSAYKGGNRTGIYGVFLNPANITSGTHKWEINLFSGSVLAANDNVKVGLKNLGNLEDQLLEGEAKKLSGIVNLDFIGPSIAYKISTKHAVALTTRVRGFGNIAALDTKFAHAVTSDNSEILKYNLSTGTQKITVNGWSEIGASWGGVLMNKGNHCLKAGATLKFLKEAGNSFVDIKDLRGTLTADISAGDVYLTNGSGSLYITSSGVDMFNSDLNMSDLTESNGTGIGFDIGFTYEYRKKSDEKLSYNSNYPYKFKVGISLLDVGSLSYKSAEGSAYRYKLDVPVGQKFYLKGLNGSVEEMQAYLEESPYAEKESVAESYKPSLPATLNLMADYYWGNHFFTEITGQFSLIDKDKKIENSYYYNGVTLTPRYERDYFGVALPLNYNSISDLNAGMTLRMGAFMVGSGSIITALLSEHKQVDVFLGVRFGF